MEVPCVMTEVDLAQRCQELEAKLAAGQAIIDARKKHEYERGKAYRVENLEACRAAARKYYDNHTENLNASRRAKYAAKKAAQLAEEST